MGGHDLDQTLPQALTAARERRAALLPERVALDVAREIGLRVPASIEVASAEEAATADLSKFTGDRLVVKLVSPDAAHRSDLGGVVFCDRQPAALERAVATVERRVGGRAFIDAFSVHDFVEHEEGPGGELLLGARWTDDFGPVAVLGLGGLTVERLTQGSDLSPVLASLAVKSDSGGFLPIDHPLVRFLTRPYRGRAPRWERRRLEDLVARLLAFAERWMAPGNGLRISDFEVNPVAHTPRGPVALDALLRPASGSPVIAPPRPIDRLRHLLTPSTIAVAGVSRRMNIGRVILRNIARQGFDRNRLWVVKPGSDEIDGCRCFESFEALPEPADLAVLAVAAAQLPELVDKILDEASARSLILIPGGVGEREGSEEYAERIADAIRRGREGNGGPLVNGGNCLGVRSVPGRYDTLFIPGHKLDLSGTPVPLALLSQSGAFAVARASKLSGLDPRYIVTFGNQVDLTLGDYLDYLERDPEVAVFACYIEGFRPLDGRAFLRATRKITASGRAVILYRAGRTPAGARAAASHTASVAGSYRVTTELAMRAGAMVADSLEDFDDLTRLFCRLDGRGSRVRGRRLAAMSNAGFESVAMGDSLGDLELARLGPGTQEKLAEIFASRHIETIVAPRNPLDVTPVLDDEAFVAAARALLEDEGVDLGLIGCVPLTGALQTLPAGEGHREALDDPQAIAGRLAELWRASTKPWAAVIDSGSLYNPLADALESAGIPTFRSADRALRALGAWVRFQL